MILFGLRSRRLALSGAARPLIAVVVLIGLTISGCATPVYNYSPKRTDISEPPLDSINVAYVGDNLLRQGSFTEHDALYVESEVEVGGLGAYTIKKGYYLKDGEDAKSAYFSPARGDDAGAIVPSALADPPKSVQAYKSEKKLCGVSVFNGVVCSNKASYRFATKPIATADSFQQTLLYSGRVGSKIKLGYREFASNVARPAFSNDVEYDLGESRIVGYKGARLEVLEATNETIRYKVLRNFNAAQ